RYQSDLSLPDQALLVRFMDTLDERVNAINACGLPDTLVHGDFHSGNVRANADQLTLMDWGDCFIGHPLLDMTGLLERLPAGLAQIAVDSWCEAWQAYLPQARVYEAVQLLKPLDCLRMAVTYQHFLDHIEPAEQIYHAADPMLQIQAALAVLGAPAA
ncbi:MAG: phosphotransferase, partial [Pseudomonadales bacterium]|nr:phosphotransferase [Pseudomonadales bacterium]